MSTTKKSLVYLIDDEEGILFVLAEILVALGHATKKFTNAEIALTTIKEDDPDLVISDIRMPEMDGVSFFKKLQQHKLQIPVVFFSGFLSLEIINEMSELGAFGFIEKPFKEGVLKSSVRNAIEISKYRKTLKKQTQIVLDEFQLIDLYLENQNKSELGQKVKASLKELIELQ